MKKALILGVSGQDGAYLAKSLLDKGYLVYGSSRDIQMSSFQNLKYLGIRNNVELISIAITDFRSVLQSFTKVLPDEIYNLAGQSSPNLSFEQPVETFESISVGCLNILEAIRFLNKSVRLYNACSSECFGNTNGEPANENTPFRPRSPYAVAKVASFWEVANYREAYDLYACSGILFNHESPFRPERFVTQKIVYSACRIANGSSEKLFLGNINIQRDWGWAPEYVEAMWLMLQQDRPQDFVIATAETNSLESFVDTAFSKLGVNWKDHVEIKADLFRPLDILISQGNPEKAEKILGWKAVYKMNDVVEMMINARLRLDTQTK